MKNFLLALSLSTILLNPQGCLGFPTFNPSTTATVAVGFRFRSEPEPEPEPEPTVTASIDASPRDANRGSIWANGPHASLAAAIIMDLCKDSVTAEDLSVVGVSFCSFSLVIVPAIFLLARSCNRSRNSAVRLKVPQFYDHPGLSSLILGFWHVMDPSPFRVNKTAWTKNLGGGGRF